MDKVSQNSINKEKVSSLAIDGLFFGLAAGLAMLLYLLVVAWLTPTSMDVLLGSLIPGDATTSWQGLLTHLAVSMIYGAIFGAIWSGLRRFLTQRWAWVGGMVYGLTLFLLAKFAFLPGNDTPLIELSPLHLAATHLVYGLVLGTLFANQLSKPD